MMIWKVLQYYTWAYHMSLWDHLYMYMTRFQSIQVYVKCFLDVLHAKIVIS